MVIAELLSGLKQELQERFKRDGVDIEIVHSIGSEMLFLINETDNILLGITIINGNKLIIGITIINGNKLIISSPNHSENNNIYVDITNSDEFNLDDMYKKIRVLCQRWGMVNLSGYAIIDVLIAMQEELQVRFYRDGNGQHCYLSGHSLYVLDKGENKVETITIYNSNNNKIEIHNSKVNVEMNLDDPTEFDMDKIYELVYRAEYNG